MQSTFYGSYKGCWRFCSHLRLHVRAISSTWHFRALNHTRAFTDLRMEALAMSSYQSAAAALFLCALILVIQHSSAQSKQSHVHMQCLQTRI